MSYDPLHTPGSTVPVPGPLDLEVRLARDVLAEVSTANIHAHIEMIEAAASLDCRLRFLLAALDAERGGQP
ncbi:hypothetical protein [Streptomyces sp. AN091965]|uniref:hypothetical protein n=1 Tax=Streptomyces sp. AN091965 TaxID=2927803 RepID=UPI001F604BC4|nr:hypothetical protein [Streptomyces sp. AN091965]MCI3930201.1 hypothetical protein [Streptomyces sp. AN091965]